MSKKQQISKIKSSQTTVFCLPIIIFLFLAIFVIHEIVNFINTSTEEHRNYAINLSEEYTFDCNASLDENSSSIKCSDQQIEGSYSTYNTIILKNNYQNEAPIIRGEHFTEKVPSVAIDSSFYKTENYSEDIAKKSLKESTIELSLYNTFLKRNVLVKTIHIHHRLTEADLKLINDKNLEWKKQEAERIALQEKAAAEEKAEAERKAAEEARRHSAQQAPRSTTNTSGGSNGTSNDYSPNTGTNTTVSGYCNDGTFVTGNPAARGKANACYGHRGWRDY